MILRMSLICLLVTGTILSGDQRSRIRRPQLRVRPDTGPARDTQPDTLEKQARQLSRERSRIRRPQRRQRPVENSFADEDDDTTLSRFAGSRGRPDPEEDERPRFVPSSDRDPDRFSRNRGGSSSSSSFSNSISSASSASKDSDYKLVCYYTNWSQYRPKIGKFLPEDIDPFLCTHVIFAFGWLKNGKLASFEENDETGGGKVGLYDRVTGLKGKNPNLKVLLAIGGWSFGTAKFKEVAKSRFSRQTFVFSAVEFLRENNFDGLDMDWEYPKSSDKESFSSLLTELRQAFEYEAEESRKPRLLLSAAVPVGPDNVRGGYDVPTVAKALDFVNLMVRLPEVLMETFTPVLFSRPMISTVSGRARLVTTRHSTPRHQTQSGENNCPLTLRPRCGPGWEHRKKNLLSACRHMAGHSLSQTGVSTLSTRPPAAAARPGSLPGRPGSSPTTRSVICSSVAPTTFGTMR